MHLDLNLSTFFSGLGKSRMRSPNKCLIIQFQSFLFLFSGNNGGDDDRQGALDVRHLRIRETLNKCFAIGIFRRFFAGYFLRVPKFSKDFLLLLP
jgi:hypothetical protein